MQKSSFCVSVPSDLKGKLVVFVEGPRDSAPVNMIRQADGSYLCDYTPLTPGQVVTLFKDVLIIMGLL